MSVISVLVLIAAGFAAGGGFWLAGRAGAGGWIAVTSAFVAYGVTLALLGAAV